MKKTILILSVVFFLSATVLTAVQWNTVTADKFNIQFKIPANWSTETDDDADVPSMISASPEEDIVLIGYVYKDSDISTEELLDQAVDGLNMDLEGEAEETEINGMLAWIGVGAGVIDDEVVGIIIMAATHKDNNYVVYIFTKADAFEDNFDLMEEIVTSFTPLD